MERLSHLIDEAVGSNKWVPISLVAGGPQISHLFYADDLILFGQASLEQAEACSRCLEEFCAASGLNISKEKSQIFCSRNTSRGLPVSISSSLGISLTQDLGRYLGVPTLHGRTDKGTYQAIVDKLDNKLAGWKAKSLSLAGRVTLATSALSAIPAYVMQAAVLPATTCEAIDRRIRNFVWGSTSEERKTHLVSWEQICKSKELGGLGLRLARDLNTAYLVKLAFTFKQRPELLWVRILHSKYFWETTAGLRPRNRASQSAVWRGLTRAWPTMVEGSRSGIRDGKETLFWTGRWLDSGIRLIDQVVTELDGVDPDERVCDVVTASGDWDFERLRRHLAVETINQITDVTPPSADSGDDTWVWGCESDGKFSIRTAYNLVNQSVSARPPVDWKLIWKWDGPNKVKHFLWLVAHGKILTNEERVRRKMTTIADCPRCSGVGESVMHILRECPFAVQVWSSLGFSADHPLFSCPDSSSWVAAVTKHSNSLLLGITCWYLWKARNELVFTNSRQISQELGQRALIWSQVVKSAMAKERTSLGIPPHRNWADIQWDPGDDAGAGGGVILNSDGSADPRSGRATAGGLIRDLLGRCSIAYTCNLGYCSITRAELRGISAGLKLAWEAGFRRILVQSDSRSVISLILNDEAPTHQHTGEVLLIRSLVRREWDVSFSHVYREANKSADFLARLGYERELGLHRIDTSDCNLGYFLRLDCMGISEPRLISIN
ncbi:Putative ribonuclease H protein At1g65750 [Linum perenne]